jgi:hypothetical protein
MQVSRIRKWRGNEEGVGRRANVKRRPTADEYVLFIASSAPVRNPTKASNLLRGRAVRFRRRACVKFTGPEVQQPSGSTAQAVDRRSRVRAKTQTGFGTWLFLQCNTVRAAVGALPLEADRQ